MLFQRLALALAAGLAIGAFARDVDVSKKREVPVSHILHERQLDHWSRSWEKRGKVPASALLPMRIGLRQSNIEQGRSMLAER
jgi:tripeptidyl-peptidase-1